jgi:hypothetical protein
MDTRLGQAGLPFYFLLLRGIHARGWIHLDGASKEPLPPYKEYMKCSHPSAA